MKKSVDLIDVFLEICNQYEKKHGEMVFFLQKIEHDWCFTDANQNLLDTVKLKREDVVGQNLDSPYISPELAKKLQSTYEKAWSGKRIMYYFVPESNTDIFLVVILKSRSDRDKVTEIEGRCFYLDSKQFPEAASTLLSIDPFQLINET